MTVKVLNVFKSLILNGENIADADFKPVAIGFAVSCGLTSVSIIYTFIVGRKVLSSKNKIENETPDISVEDRKSSTNL